MASEREVVALDAHALEAAKRAMVEATGLSPLWGEKAAQDGAHAAVAAYLSALSDRSRSEVGGDVVERCPACRGEIVAINGKAHCLPCRQSYRPVPEMAGIAFEDPDPVIAKIAADAERRVHAEIAAKMRATARANLDAGNGAVGLIYDAIAKELDHA